MSIERRRRLKKHTKNPEVKKEKRMKKERANPKKEFSEEEIQARKKAQRTGIFEKKKKLYKR